MDDGASNDRRSPSEGDAADRTNQADNSVPAANFAGDLDRLLHAMEGHLTKSLSPTTISLALADWLLHLGNAPGKRLDLWLRACEIGLAATNESGRQIFSFGTSRAEPEMADRRFRAPSWDQPPFNFLRSNFLHWEEWWQDAATGITGVKASHERVVGFLIRQALDACSPANHLASNPELLRTTVERRGSNLLQGFSNLIDDLNQAQQPTAARSTIGEFKIGRDLAATPGKVVFRNALMELIQYAPTTASVIAEPILLIPAWIMKYYILDLSPYNSLVRHLVSAGFTVFMISWRNPGPTERHWGMEDYRVNGVGAALDAIAEIVPGQAVHGCGYCLGGTLLAIETARLARERDPRLATLTLLAAQTDFTEPGEIKVFTSEDQVAFLDDIMWQRGYLDGAEMAGAFQLLRSNDLIWSRFVHQYLLGEKEVGTDLTAWNADLTRLPHRMHAEYLRRLFVKNELAQGHFLVEGRPVALSDVRLPLFAVGTETDHIAPWRSVYKIRLLSRSEVTFVLTKGGHNAGIVSEPGHSKRHFRIATDGPLDPFVDPDSWVSETALHEGSWWPAWTEWLRRHSDRDQVPARALETGLADAPGMYVMEK
jgi:polyhydroxyalkanoate synthase